MPALTHNLRRDDGPIEGWRDDPDGRGTMGLIWSCILTLALCVWSALHLNIPPKHDSKANSWLRILRWVILGILAPELVLWAAWRQWASANALTKEIQSALKDEEFDPENRQHKEKLRRQDSGLRRKHEWTHLHSFYVNMGGFVFDTTESTEEEMDFIPNNRRLTLSPSAVVLLAKCGHLPDIDPDDIKDKSKADSLAKFVVLLQAIWFLVQTLARIAQQLPVSLLEVNTIGHVLCALVIYLLWWNKPREVQEPTVLRGEWAKPLCSYMYMSSRMSGVQYRRGIRPSAWISPELENLIYVAPDGNQSFKRSDTSTRLIAQDVESADEIVEKRTSDPSVEEGLRKIRFNPTVTSAPDPDSATNATEHTDFGSFITQIRRQDTAHTAARKRKLGWEVDESTKDTSSLRTTRRSYCARAFVTYPAVREHFERKTPTSLEYDPKPQQFVVASAINWPSDFLLEPLAGQVVGMVLWFVSIMYGSVHLAAWREYFPSDVERLLWHMSAGYIAASGLWWTVAHVLFYLWSWLDNWWDRFIRLRNHWLQYVVYGFLMTCAGVFYILARAYLTVEGIVSLRSAPSAMYETVNWSRFIPHF